MWSDGNTLDSLCDRTAEGRHMPPWCVELGGNPCSPIGGEASVFFNCSLDTLSLCLSIGLWMQLLRLCVCSRLKVSGNSSISFHRIFGTKMSPWLITHNASCPRKVLYWFIGLNVCVCECWRGTEQRSGLVCWRVGLILRKSVGVFGEQLLFF